MTLTGTTTWLSTSFFFLSKISNKYLLLLRWASHVNSTNEWQVEAFSLFIKGGLTYDSIFFSPWRTARVFGVPTPCALKVRHGIRPNLLTMYVLLLSFSKVDNSTRKLHVSSYTTYRVNTNYFLLQILNMYCCLLVSFLWTSLNEISIIMQIFWRKNEVLKSVITKAIVIYMYEIWELVSELFI